MDAYIASFRYMYTEALPPLFYMGMVGECLRRQNRDMIVSYCMPFCLPCVPPKRVPLCLAPYRTLHCFDVFVFLIFLDFREPAEVGVDSAAGVVLASDLDSFHNLLVTPTASNDPPPCLSIGVKTPTSIMGILCKSSVLTHLSCSVDSMEPTPCKNAPIPPLDCRPTVRTYVRFFHDLHCVRYMSLTGYFGV